MAEPPTGSNRLSVNPLTAGNLSLAWGTRTYVMGILNLTPDSFSGDGLLPSPLPPSPPPSPAMRRGRKGRAADRVEEEGWVREALAQAIRFLAAGADILDVGGESTRPGSQPVEADEELRRLLPVIRAIQAEAPQALISVDTYKAAVAEQALQAGAGMLNDVWGLRADPQLASVATRFGAPVVLMHNRSKPANVEVRERLGAAYLGAEYGDLLGEVKAELLASVQIARAAGIPDEAIILDPGLGFGKTVAQNLELIDRLGELRGLGYPILIGPSRKSFIGYTLDLPPDQRLEGTAAAVAVAITRGADIVRVHDVEAMVRVARMTDALVRRR
jgi:dihydropteroate synthase